MRLIDADAEINKIEQEIKRIESRIEEWENKREDRSGYHDVDAKIQQLRRNISDARSEIKYLKKYSTAYDVDKVVEQMEKDILELKDQLMYTTDEDMAVRLRCKMHGLDRAIGIVKAGGVNENR